CKAWVQESGNHDLLEIDSCKLHKSLYLCQKHFLPENFTDGRKKRRKQGVIPSAFSRPPLPDKDMTVWPQYNLPKKKRSQRLFPPPDEDIRVKRPNHEEMDVAIPHVSRLMDRTEARSPTVGLKERILMRPRTPPPDPPRRLTCRKIAMESGITDPSTLTPREERLARSALEYHTIARRIKLQLRCCQRRAVNLRTLAKKSTVDVINEMFISPETKIILESQLVNWKKKPQTRRWTIKMKCLALAIWKRSRRVYRWLSTMMALPVESTLRDLLVDIPLESGINIVAMDNLSKKTAQFSSKDRVCQVMFDEVSLKTGLYWNNKSKIIEGFEDYGLNGRTVALATHALVFMVQGINRKFKQPVAFHFSRGTCPNWDMSLNSY
ncbi:DNA transposase, partial [Frankliniella fusca]